MATEFEYKQIEKSDGENRYEFINSEIYPLLGDSLNHARITGNLLAKINTHLLAEKCEVFSIGVQVKLNQGDKIDYVHSDLVVDSSPEQAENAMLINPILVTEVLSPRTRHKDENAKFQAYIQVPTLQEYVIIEQDVAKVEIQRRRTGWAIEKYGLGDSITFESIGLTVAVADIYEKVENADVKYWLENLKDNQFHNQNLVE